MDPDQEVPKQQSSETTISRSQHTIITQDSPAAEKRDLSTQSKHQVSHVWNITALLSQEIVDLYMVLDKCFPSLMLFFMFLMFKLKNLLWFGRSAEMMVVVCLSCIITSIPVSLYNLVSFLFANESAVIKALESGDYKWIMWSYHIR